MKEPPDIIERLARSLDALALDHDIVFLPFTPNDTDTESDTSFHEKIINKMKAMPVQKAFAENIQTIDLLIGMRLHALISAVNLGKQVIALDYDAKVGRIFSDLNLGDRVISYDGIDEIPNLVREKIFAIDHLASREKANDALVARLCADIREDPRPKISVVMPTYNRAHLLREAIDSLLSQTETDWELILIDDGGTDDTAALAASYRDDRIRYYNFGHNGISWSRNIGNCLSRGEMIVVADSDDINLPNRLEATHSRIMESGADIFYSAMYHFSDHAQRELIPSFPFTKERLAQGNFIYHPTVAYRREVAMQCPYREDLEMVEDYDLYLCASDKGFTYCWEEAPLVMHRLHGGQISVERSDEMSCIHEALVQSQRRPPEGTSTIQMPLVSVIVPTYNRPAMLEEALRSVLAQTYTNFEIVVVNDAGEDVADVINRFQGRAKISYLRHSENKGLAAARNTGIRAANGKYIAYLDDDDLYYPQHLEVLIGFLENSDYRVAYTDSLQAFQSRINDRYVTTKTEKLFSHDFDRDLFLVNNYIPVLNIVHRRDLLEEVGYFDETLGTHEDWELSIRLSRKYDYYHIKSITAEFRVRDDATNMTDTKRSDFLRTLRLIYQRYAHLVTDAATLEAQKNMEEYLAADVAIRQLPSPELARQVEQYIKRKDQQINSLAAALRNKDAHISNLEAAIKDKDTQVCNLEAAIRDKDAQVENLNSALNNIYKSHGWKVLRAYYRVMNSLFPHDTRRRRICEWGLKGFRRFFAKSK